MKRHHFVLPKLVLATLLLLLVASFSDLPSLIFSLSRQQSISPDQLSGNFESASTQAEFHGQQLTAPLAEAVDGANPVLGDTDATKRIEVDLTNQRLYAYEGDRLVHNFLVSTGKWGRTPTGTFNIWGKFRYTKMSGGSKLLNTYYYLPNVPYVMFFSNQQIAASRGFGLHGTYWHNNFGHPMSHGCVNMRTEDAMVIFNWSQPAVADGTNTARTSADNTGTQIVIYGVAPSE